MYERCIVLDSIVTCEVVETKRAHLSKQTNAPVGQDISEWRGKPITLSEGAD
jgi:hypothetical protein